MSQENVEQLRQARDAFIRRDLDAFLACMDPGVDFTPYTVAMQGSYQGHEGIRGWWRELFDVFPDWALEIEETRDLGDVTLTLLHGHGHGGESRAPAGQTLWQVAEWRGGRIVRMSNHGSEAEALEAVELSE